MKNSNKPELNRTEKILRNLRISIGILFVGIIAAIIIAWFL